jgi:Tol biopolymer transport system component
VADDPKSPRALAAAALLQIGRLHEKLGSREAIRAYARVAKDFADQPQFATEARKRLSALGAGTNVDDTQVVARQVWAGEGADAFGSVSPDGRLYAYSDWRSTQTGNLAVRDLATGEVRRFTNLCTYADGSVGSPAWSLDGKRLAYLFNDQVVKVVASDGTGSRDVFSRQDAYPSAPRWSPDGRTLAMVLWTYGEQVTSELVLVALDTGRVSRSRPGGIRDITLGGFSTDGRHVLFGLAARQATDDGGVYLLAVDSGRETTLVSGPGRYAKPAWSPDGAAVVFLSDRSGAMGLWAVTMVDGGATGQPRLLRPNTGELTFLAFSRNATLWYGVASMTSDVYVCDFDPVALAPLSEPARLSDRFFGGNSGPAWSPDGRHIAYMRGVDRAKRAVIIRRVDSGDERELPAPFTNTVHASNWGPTWLPDGSGVLVSDVNFATSRFTIHQLDLDKTHPVLSFDGDFNKAWPHLRVSPDARTLYFTRRDPTPSIDRGTLILVRRDRASGEETELYRAPSLGAVGFFGLALSADGSLLAFSQNTGDNTRDLIVVPTKGGAHRVVYSGTYTMPQPQSGAWAPDGRHLLVSGRLASDPRDSTELWAIPVQGGPPRPLGVKRSGGISAASLSPDGKRLAFAGGNRTGELWSLSNVLGPALTGAKQ